ncbi:MAG: ribosome biogenesis GTPase Der [Acidobacteriota bacterium]|nr:ribosome biogenesis GTPase Der [Acidobacteriota bacterium]
MREYPAGNRLVILGRPNVGKSTLFNRICGRRRSLVGDEPGMTRDRIYAPAEWRGRRFEVIDTGGLSPDDDSVLAREIFNQAKTAMAEAGQWLLVVDAQTGLTPLDEELAARLRREGKPVIVAVNKIDTAKDEGLANDFYRLGIADVFPVSSEHGRGIDDLLDHATRDFAQAEGDEEDRSRAVRVAIIGRPNTGKSTLLNRLTGTERSIVAAEAGTTRDAVDAEIEANGRRFLLIDTAGIRRKGKTRLMAEKLSVIQARKHLERSDIALLLIDAAEGVTALDAHIGGYAHESRRSVVIVVNKWDAVKKGASATADFTRQVRERLKYLNYAPIVFVSALRGQRIQKLLESVSAVADERSKRVSTAEMNRFLKTVDFDRAPSPAGKPLRLYYLTQAGISPPTFVAFTNRDGPLYFSVERFLENRIRERFGFVGAPIVIQTRRRG